MVVDIMLVIGFIVCIFITAAIIHEQGSDGPIVMVFSAMLIFIALILSSNLQSHNIKELAIKDGMAHYSTTGEYIWDDKNAEKIYKESLWWGVPSFVINVVRDADDYMEKSKGDIKK